MFPRVTTLAAGLLAAVLAQAANASEPNGGFSDARLTYGAYLAETGGCMACHTRPGGRPFEGGRGIDTAFGTLYTPNITPSRGYGIGGFSDEDFLRALHEGVGPGGRPYYPACPYPSYNKVGDDDLLAIKDYLFSLDPSGYRPPEDALRWPFSIRELMFGWQELYLRRGRFQADSGKGEQWNRGAYLVEGLGHCGACHRARDVAGSSDSGDALAGTVIDGWYGTSPVEGLNEAVGERSVDELAALLGELGAGIAGPAPDGELPAQDAGAAPAERLHVNLSRLALSDLQAMAVYLKDPRPTPPFTGEPLVPQGLSGEVFANGRALYLKHCSACHQGQGQGLKPYFPPLQRNPAVTADETKDLIETLLLGAPAKATDAFSDLVLMPSFRSVLSDHQIADVVSFIRGSWGNDAAPVTADEVRALR